MSMTRLTAHNNQAAQIHMKLSGVERHDRGAPTTNQDSRYYAWNNEIWLLGLGQ
jgi:hypothetical protein